MGHLPNTSKTSWMWTLCQPTSNPWSLPAGRELGEVDPVPWQHCIRAGDPGTFTCLNFAGVTVLPLHFCLLHDPPLTSHSPSWASHMQEQAPEQVMWTKLHGHVSKPRGALLEPKSTALCPCLPPFAAGSSPFPSAGAQHWWSPRPYVGVCPNNGLMVEHIGEVAPGEHPAPHPKYTLRMQEAFPDHPRRFFSPSKSPFAPAPLTGVDHNVVGL